ncbi:MAG: DNA-directed RNA polymerase subunit N [Bradyrhizobium sp.]|nr:DNA-directed RNA polymerase subunit N [Bradyrhizobium sp.]
MKKQIAIVAAAMMVSTAAVAGERAADAAIGAVSGAVVLGPIGAVAGAFIGYTAGPSMSRAWGVRGRSASARQQRRVASDDTRPYRESQAAMRDPSAAPAAAPAPKPAAKSPPVQPLE